MLSQSAAFLDTRGDEVSPASDPNARAALNREVGSIQMQMARRGQEQKALRDEIAKLEADTGLASQGSGENGK